MKRFNGYDDAKKEAQYSGSKKLPAGAYVCKVMAVRYEEGQNGYSDRIAIQFDIAEGEHKDFFKEQYEANTSEDKKWKGKTAVYVPKDDGSVNDGYTKKSFAGWTDAFEQSNDGYSWDWDEQKWKNKLVGIVFGETGTILDGKEIIYTEARFAIPASKVRDGSAPIAKFKTKNGYTGTSNSSSAMDPSGFVNIPEGAESEIPF